MSSMQQMMARWGSQVRAYLIGSPGGAMRISDLANRCTMPPALRDALATRQRRPDKRGGSGACKAGLLQMGFHINSGYVSLQPLSRAPISNVSGQRRGRDEDDDGEDGHRRNRQRAASPSLDPFAAGLRTRNTFRFGTPSHHTGLVEAPPSRPPAREFDWSRYTMVHQQPQSQGQARYHAKLASADINIVICLGPAGCGKTLFAVQQGLNELKAGLVKKMIISRPAVTAGESLGFLPGSEKEKLQPGAAPVLDSIDKIMGEPGAWAALQNHHLLELQSFAYMRGRTHDDSFVIADETQNALSQQIDMLVTRVGTGTRLCIVGDGEQSDRASTAFVEFAELIEGGGLERAGAANIAGRVVVQRLTVDDCKRSEVATGMAQLIRFRAEQQHRAAEQIAM